MKKFITIILVLIILCSAVGCSNTYKDKDKDENKVIGGRYKVIEASEYVTDFNWTMHHYIVYDVTTKAKYIYIEGGNASVSISPLYDEFGKVDYYEGE